MAIEKVRITELYMACEHVFSIWCEASMRCNQSIYASWHGIKDALDIFLGNVPPRSLYASPQSVKSSCWRTLTNKTPTNHIPDMFDERYVWDNVLAGEAVIPVIFGRRLAQSLPRVVGHCPAEIWQYLGL